MKKLAIIITHPIQYYTPLFKTLTERKKIQLKVFYTWGSVAKGSVYDPGFGMKREWDIPLLDGYEFEFIENISTKPGSHHFWGINNPTLIKKIIEYNASAVLIVGWKFYSHLKAMYYFKGKIPVLFRGDSTLLDDPKRFSIKKIIRRCVLSAVYCFIDYALYAGTNNKKYFLANGVSSNKLVYAPNVVDNDRFENNVQQLESLANDWKKNLNIPLNKISILFVGKFVDKKNPLLLIETAKKFDDFHFIIVGDGELSDEIERRSAGIENITLLPFQNQSKMPLVYRLADVFVLPSRGPEETWGLAMNEAMASSRVVIASNKCGGAIDLIEDRKNGFIIEPDLDGFCEALNWLKENKNEIPTLQDHSAKLIRKFTIETLAKNIEELIT